MKKDLPHKFKVPENYFTNLEEQILNQVAKDPSIKVIPLYRKAWVRAVVGIAASLLLILGFYLNFNQIEVTEADRVTAQEVLVETFFEDYNYSDEFVLDDEPLYADIEVLAED